MIYNKLGENAVSITCQNVEGWHTTLMKNIFLHSFHDLKSKEVHVFINLAYYINICLSQAFGRYRMAVVLYLTSLQTPIIIFYGT